jgi:3-oxoacyl-[acyl-carrier-protein] synthase-3
MPAESRFRIVEVCAELGENELDVASIAADFEKAALKTGIFRVFETERDSYELSLVAARKLIEANPEIRSGPITLIHVSQSNSDFLPAYACRLQHDLELDTEVFAFDIGQGCSGFVQALYLASKLISDFENVIIICCDTYRAKLDRMDRSTSTIFSDGATATLIQRGGNLRVAAHKHITDGSGAELLYHSRNETKNSGKLFMSGAEVLLFTKRIVFRQAEEAVARAGITMAEVDSVLVHQASKLVLDELERRFGSEVSFPRNIEEYGNTVSSSIPLLIQNKLYDLNNSTSVLCGFGVGLSSSCLVLTTK